MIEILNELKTQLFDAPSEVKGAFNSIVGYFDKEYAAKGYPLVFSVGVIEYRDMEGWGVTRKSVGAPKKKTIIASTPASVSKEKSSSTRDARFKEKIKRDLELRAWGNNGKLLEILGTFNTKAEAKKKAEEWEKKNK